MNDSVVPVDPHEILTVPKRRRFVPEYTPTENGGRELRIFYGSKEITFDGPEEMAFGERLLEEDSFMAGSATTWSRGEPYPWERVREWLEALVAEGIVERSDEGVEYSPEESIESVAYRQHLETEANRVAPESPPWWNPDCRPLLEQLTGRSLDLGYFECVLPVHRIAHPALDAEQRQVGEQNVFPEALRMKIPTDLKRCVFAGSRHQHEMPMNVSALRTMKRYWGEMLETVYAIREDFVNRYPISPQGWTIGDIVLASTAVLAVPTYMLMRADDPVPNGALDPVLSSTFRVVDGIRMVANYLFLNLDDPRPYDTPMSGEQLHFLTERDNWFISNRGVCAGPSHMVQELFDTLLDGKRGEGTRPKLGDWVRQIPAGTDYGLLGTQVHTISKALWSKAALAYTQIRIALLDDPSVDQNGEFYAAMQRDFKFIQPGRMHVRTERDYHDARYDELLQHAQRGVRGFEEPRLMTLKDVVTPQPGVLGDSGREQLRAIFRAHPAMRYATKTVEAIADEVYEFLRVERTVLGKLDPIQRRINALLKRPHPTKLLTGNDLGIANRLKASGSVPYLMDVFHDFGIFVDNTESATRVTYGSNTVELN